VPNILLVDDDLNAALPLALALEQNGHRVTVTADASNALPLLWHQRIDCLVTDFEMPGLDGAQLSELYPRFLRCLSSCCQAQRSPWSAAGAGLIF
jgi:CheY-like chemotaxis protein